MSENSDTSNPNDLPGSAAESGHGDEIQDIIEEPINWEERYNKLELQLQALIETSQLRKRMIEIKQQETQQMHIKLKGLADAIAEEKQLRTNMMMRVEAAELECGEVKDKLKRNIEALERLKGHHERKVTMLTARLDISEIQGQGKSRKLEEANRKNAELKGLLEELQLKLNENKKMAKGLEKELKKANDKNKFLTTQVSMVGQLLDEDDVTGLVEEGGSLGKIRNIIKESEEQEEETNKTSDDDEGVDLDSLMELDEDPSYKEAYKDIPGEESCYKTVDTSSGPQLILSVSRTFLKLQDLILEKRMLRHQIDNLKGFNNKLETKVDKQERRLYCVTKELNKTWSLVTKLKKQQDALHNNEAYLRYELKENRVIVEKLKKEMQSYQEQWKKVREKNEESQTAWQQLKDEFAQRRQESFSSSSPSPSPKEKSPSPLQKEKSPPPPEETSAVDTETPKDNE